jgi:four helix bundle protein
MFDFQKLNVYQKAKVFHSSNRELIKTHKVDSISKNQLSRASLSIPLNIAEGAGKFSKPDRANYYTTARASLFECVAILDILRDEKIIEESVFSSSESNADELSRMLFAMIRNLKS